MDSIDIVRGKPLNKDETKFLLELVEKSKFILSKTTNATNNKLKTEEWLKISNIFNATATLQPRTPQQLRLKWENLKKNARKRSTKIRMSRIQTGGGVPEYIAPDDILDRVSDMLGSTGCGYIDPFGGDKEPECIIICGGDGEDDSISEGATNKEAVPRDSIAPALIDNAQASCSSSLGTVIEVVEPKEFTPLKMNMPRAGKKKLNSITKRNLAIADYYISKKKCVDASLENILLQNEKLKLENEKLKLELKNINKQ